MPEEVGLDRRYIQPLLIRRSSKITEINAPTSPATPWRK
jgi:hypothetical protein